MDIQSEFKQLTQDIERLRSKLETAEASRGYGLAIDRALKAVRDRAVAVNRRDRRERGDVEGIWDCPFCGSVIAELQDNYIVSTNEKETGVSFTVGCPYCRAHGPYMDAREQAVRQWNGVALTMKSLGKRT